jgi:hypothetical protein
MRELSEKAKGGVSGEDPPERDEPREDARRIERANTVNSPKTGEKRARNEAACRAGHTEPLPLGHAVGIRIA